MGIGLIFWILMLILVGIHDVVLWPAYTREPGPAAESICSSFFSF